MNSEGFPKNFSQRAQAVLKCWRGIMDIIDDRDKYEEARAYLRKHDPETIINSIMEGKIIPKWHMDLFVSLTHLYDKGHADAMGQIEKFTKKK